MMIKLYCVVFWLKLNGLATNLLKKDEIIDILQWGKNVTLNVVSYL